jgi:hypothetical protein
MMLQIDDIGYDLDGDNGYVEQELQDYLENKEQEDINFIDWL